MRVNPAKNGNAKQPYKSAAQLAIKADGRDRAVAAKNNRAKQSRALGAKRGK